MKKLFTFLFALASSFSMYADQYYLVGGATDSGWSKGEWERSAVRAYSADGTTWVAAVKLTVGEGDNGRFKIPNSSGDWDGLWATSQGTVLTSEWSDLSTTNVNNVDYKFCVAEEGLYLVSFNTSTLKIKAEKLTEPSKDGDYYLISSVNDYYWFAAYIATDATNASKARLTANLSFEGKTFTPMASDKHKFKGEFDGNGHTIDYAIVNSDYSNIGLFCYADVAYIHDLVIGANSSFKGVAKVGGIIGFARDRSGDVTLKNVINEARVEATGSTDANAAGLVGCATDGTKIFATNCANTGEVRGQDGQCAAFTGWAQSGTTFTNCWNIGDIYNMQDNNSLYRGDGVSVSNCYDANGNESYRQGTKIARSTVASGELCFKLNGDQSSIVWYQTLGTDADVHPVPFSTGGHSQVYATGDVKCDGTLLGNNTFTNDASESATLSHSNANGWCTVCEKLDANYLIADGEGFYSIDTADKLHWFAELVNTVNQSAKAKLTADIDYTNYKQGFIGTSQGTPFRGVFDGQEHTIKVDIVNAGSTRTGLFAYINAATIRNLVVEGSATSAGNNCVGGLGGRSDGDGTLIENVIVKTAVSYTGSNPNNDATCGGFFANMEGQVTLKNCAFLGSIETGTAEGNGGLVGWAGGGGNNQYINCLVAPTQYTKNGNSADFARNNPQTVNCYKVGQDDARLATGEFCCMLNGEGDNWFQNLNEDAMPVPFSSHSKVYANASYTCDGTPKGAVVYSNVDEVSRDEHTVDNGFCTTCNSMTSYVADYMTPAEDGYYEISDNKQMRWFAAMIKDYRNVHNLTANEDCNAPVNARLMNDIDFTGVKDFAPIGGLWGQGNTRYNGTFDGQGYKITNLNINLEQNEVGIFGVIAEGAVIKNFTLSSSCSIKGNGAVGIVGKAWRAHDGEVRLESLGNEADITGAGNNVGGILGVNMRNGGYVKLYMTNCYSTGAIKGNDENGQLTGWSGDDAVLENCYAIGDMTSCDGFARLGLGSTVKNCFCDKNLTWNNHPTYVTVEQLASGEVAYKLGKAFGQTIGTDGHPVFNAPAVLYVGDAGYATMYDTTSGYELNGDAKAYVATLNDTWLDLTEVEGVPVATPVVLKGTYYNKVAANLPAISVSNDLKGTDTDIEADGTMYVLAKLDGKAGFYKAEGTIAAGKAYYQSTSGVKAFYFEGGDATGISDVNVNLNEDNAIYNIAGQRLQKMQKGINIVNGKKVLF